MTMQDLPEAEARSLLAMPLTCEDPPDWVPERIPKGLARLSCGLIDEDGISARLLLEFLFRRSPKTGIEKFILTVFKLTTHGRQRVYQLEIEKLKVAPKNLHAMPHEHFGDKRICGTKEWFQWSYDDILRKFCAETNIKFKPHPPSGPEAFELRG